MKLKSTTNELWKGWKLAWYHHFTHIACARKLRGLRQKLDALRVQNGQSLLKYQGFGRKLICYKGISFFWTYLNSIVFLCSKCTIQSHIINFQPFLTSFVIFHAYTDFWLNDPEIGKHYKWTLKRLKVGMVSSFHPHSMPGIRISYGHGCTSCTKRTISFEVSGFHTETRLLQQAFQMNYGKVESWHGIIIIVAGESRHFFLACVICLLRRNHG